MTRWVALALLAAMIPTGSSAFQARESLARGGSYFDQCVARAKDYSACIGYFMGMADAPVMNADKSADQAVYCLPADLSAFITGASDRKSTRLNSSHYCAARMPSSA